MVVLYRQICSPYQNTEGNNHYLRYCKKNDLKAHPARFPSELPEFFIRMLTDENDLVIDPFGGSCVTGEVAERLSRKWACVELRRNCLTAAMGRFVRVNGHFVLAEPTQVRKQQQYSIFRPGGLWNDDATDDRLAKDGGKGHRTRKPDKPCLEPVRPPKYDVADKPMQLRIKDV